MKKTYVYALDLSLNSTGVCIFTDDGLFVEALTIDTHSTKETKLKLSIIGKEFIRLIKKYPPDVVIIEQGFTRYNISTQALYKVQGVASYVFCNYEQVYYHSSTVKKHVGGKGNISKKELQEVIFENYPNIEFKTPDESDAFALGIHYFKERGKQ